MDHPDGSMIMMTLQQCTPLEQWHPPPRHTCAAHLRDKIIKRVFFVYCFGTANLAARKETCGLQHWEVDPMTQLHPGQHRSADDGFVKSLSQGGRFGTRVPQPIGHGEA